MAKNQLNKTQLELLAARTVISRKRYLARGTLARSGSGHVVRYDDPKAVSMCAIGALCFAINKDTLNVATTKAYKFLNRACVELYNNTFIGDINDTKGHKAVMRMYDRAIELAGEAK